MPNLDLRYGKSQISFDYDENRFEVLGNSNGKNALSDAELGARFDNPINSKPLEELINTGETVLIVVPDATRQTACASIVNLLVRRLIANGTQPFEINIIFATGIHRRVTTDEKSEILSPFIVQRIKTLDHSAKDLMQIAGLDSRQFTDYGDENGIPIELNRVLSEFDHTVIVGGITPHYFAGFSGGRKLICPGLASEQTISATHALAFDCETKSRRKGVGTGILKGNAVHEAFIAAASKAKPTFSFHTIINSQGEATEVFCGDWISAHEAACAFYAAENTLEIAEKREIVIVSCGGAPFDLNMIQAHKALETASHACTDGGTILLLAECLDGLGRKDFLDWFSAETSADLAENLCRNYQVNGQTAWSLLKKVERFRIKIITSLSEVETNKIRLQKIDSLTGIDKIVSGYIIPFGAKYLIKNRLP